ncbi:MAG: PIN domain-containing protein [Nitrospirae bacterium]|nr:PIN domain-containing protein [Candidatus Troglogloeales bacterium]
MADNVLVDTSIWIDYFQIAQGVVFDQVTRLLKENRTVFTGIIASELIRGSHSEKELSVLKTLFRSIGKVDEMETTHSNAGRMGYKLARKGVNPGTIDLIISQIAIEHSLFLYTQDQHFTMIAKHFPLKLYRQG